MGTWLVAYEKHVRKTKYDMLVVPRIVVPRIRRFRPRFTVPTAQFSKYAFADKLCMLINWTDL